MTYDSGDFAALTKQAFDLADGKGFARRKRESRKRGKLRGFGIGNFLEVTAPPSKELAAIVFNAGGTVALSTGTLDFGMVESPGGISPPGAPRTVREPLDSHGSRCSAVAMP
jgi:CO/xanthine dehydrogenase Mo-binding subunit